MRTKTIKLYTFDELSVKAKQKAISWWNETNHSHGLSDDLHEYLVELLKDSNMKPISPVHVFYSLSYSQGDGAMFTGEIAYKGYTFTIQHYGHYYHYNSKQITDIRRNNGNEITDTTWRKMFDEFEPLYVSLCKKLEDYGYELIEHEQSEDVVAETLMANEYEFDETGAIA